MKVFALIALCALATVQARSTAVQNVRTEAALGDSPYTVHLRVAKFTSGFLDTCAGALIDQSWVLTSASCLENIRFAWVRLGLVDPISPGLVLEVSASRPHPEDNLALISLGRNVHSSATIGPVALASVESSVPSSATFCAFGDNGADGPGESLNCYNFELEAQEDGTIAATSEEGAATRFDDGGALVNDGVLYGVLVGAADGERAGTFVSVAPRLEWIEEVTGLSFTD